MFSEACVKSFCPQGRGSPSRKRPLDRDALNRESPLDGDPPVLTSSGGHQSWRYASYWNAYLFHPPLHSHWATLTPTGPWPTPKTCIHISCTEIGECEHLHTIPFKSLKKSMANMYECIATRFVLRDTDTCPASIISFSTYFGIRISRCEIVHWIQRIQRCCWKLPGSKDLHGAFKLPDTETDRETETDISTDKLAHKAIGNLYCCPSLCSINTSTQFYTVKVSVSGSVNTPLIVHDKRQRYV